MDNKGWISLHRRLQDNWVWKEKPFSKGQAWVDILLECNHSGNKVLIKGKLLTVERGESLNSLKTWAKKWGWTISKVRRFLELLEKDSMIELKSEQISTRLTVCNYKSYQDKRNANETQTKRTQYTNNNDNNENNSINSSKSNINVKSINKGADFLDEIIKVFSAKYYLSRNMEYISNGKDKAAVGKLLNIYKKKNKTDSNQTLKDFDLFFTQCLNIKDNWYYQNMSLPIINSKINEIRNILRKNNVTSQEIRTAVDRNFDK